MLKLIIADSSLDRCKAIQKAVSKEYEVYYSCDCEALADLLFGIQPDILLLDLMLPGSEALALLRAANTAGICPKILVQSDFFNDHIGRALQGLDVYDVLLKPFSMDALLYKLKDIQLDQVDTEDVQQLLNRNIHSVLMALSFTRSGGGYEPTASALETICQKGSLLPMKLLHQILIDKHGGTSTQVEKAIRDSIRKAWENRNEVIWRTYFPRGKDGKIPCPSNQLFFAQVGSRLLEQYAQDIQRRKAD